MTFGTWSCWGRQPHAPAPFTPQEYSRYSFSLGVESTAWAIVRSEGNMSLKNPVTQSGIDPGTVRLVAQRRNHYATPGLTTQLVANETAEKLWKCWQYTFFWWTASWVLIAVFIHVWSFGWILLGTPCIMGEIVFINLDQNTDNFWNLVNVCEQGNEIFCPKNTRNYFGLWIFLLWEHEPVT
jgi:hypothetical protein